MRWRGSWRRWMERRWVRRALIAAAALAVLGVAALASLVGYLEVRRNQTVTLPAPTGPYAVGRTLYDVVDPARLDPYAPRPGTHRELMIFVWYPAAPVPGARPAPYLPPAWAAAVERDRGGGSLLWQRSDTIRPHAVEDAPLAAAPPTFPVLLFEPGLGSPPTNYTTLVEDVASHGYVVVGVTPTDSTDVVVFADGRVAPRVYAASEGADLDQLIQLWAGDDIFAMGWLRGLDAAGRFAGRLDLARIGVWGHSFGGAAAAQVCHVDARCRAGIDIDGTPFGSVAREGLSAPFMFILHEANPPDDPATRAIYASLPLGEGYRLVVRGTTHFNFEDYAVILTPAVVLNPLGRFRGGSGLLGSIDGARGLRITAAYVEAFFDTYLNHAASPLLSGPSPAYPDVEFSSR